MKYCKICGEEMPDRARFCMMCGTPLASEEVVQAPREARRLDPEMDILTVDSADETYVVEYGIFEITSVQERFGYNAIVIGAWQISNDTADGVYMSEPYDIDIDLEALGVDPELYEDLELYGDRGSGVMDEYPYVIEDNVLKTQSRSTLSLVLVANMSLWLCEQEHRMTRNDVPYVVENRNNSGMLGDDKCYFYYIKDQRTDKRVFKVYYTPEKQVFKDKAAYEKLEAKALQKLLEANLNDIQNEFPELKACQMNALAAIKVKQELVAECQKSRDYETIKEKAEDSGIPDWSRLDDKLMDMWEYISEAGYRIPLDLIKVYVNEGEEGEYHNPFTDRWITLHIASEDLDYEIVHGIHSVFAYQYTHVYSQDFARLLEAITHRFVVESADDLVAKGIADDSCTLMFRPEHYELLAMPMDEKDSDLTDMQKRDYGIGLSTFLAYIDEEYQKSYMPDVLENIAGCCDVCSLSQALVNGYELNIEDFNEFWSRCWTENSFEVIKAYMSYVKDDAFNQQYQPEKIIFNDNEQYRFVQGREAYYSVAVRSFSDQDHAQTAIVLDFSETDPDAIIDMVFVGDETLSKMTNGYFLSPAYGERMVLEICGGEEEYEGFGEDWSYHAAVLTPRQCSYRIESSSLVIDYPGMSEAAKRGFVKGYKAIITTTEGKVEKFDSSFGQSISYPLCEVNLAIGQPYNVTIYEYVLGIVGDMLCGPDGGEMPELKIITTGDMLGNEPEIIASMSEAESYKCPYCDAEVTEEAEFCPQCGKLLTLINQFMSLGDIMLEISGNKNMDTKYMGTTRDTFPIKNIARITISQEWIEVEIEDITYPTRYYSSNPSYHVTGKTSVTGFKFKVDTTTATTVVVDGITPKQCAHNVEIDASSVYIAGGRDEGWQEERETFFFQKEGHSVEYIKAGDDLMIMDCTLSLTNGKLRVTLMNNDLA